MIKSIVKGLKEKDVQAVVNTYTLNEYYYPTLFPLKFTATFTWKSIIADIGANIMADVVSFDSRAPRKARQVVSQATGDIPKISIGRDKTETEMNEYQSLLFYANTTDGALAIMDWVYNDVEFCFKGVNARLEWMALRAASTGKMTLTPNNNAGIVTAVDVDFLIPNTNKSGVAVSITEANAATSKPITLFKTLAKNAKAAGYPLLWAFTSQAVVDAMLVSDEAIKNVAPWVMQATQLTQIPTLNSLNSYFSQNNLPQIVVIEQQLIFEDKDNNRTVVEPWETGVILFSNSKVLGNTWYTTLADERVDSTTSIKVKRKHILLKKFATEEPLTESTIAMANAMPALAGPNRLFLVDTLNQNWTK